MLQINLIPVERRRKEKTPLPRLFAILGSVAICITLLMLDIKIVLDTNNLKTILNDKSKELSNLQETLKDFPLLQERSKTLIVWKSAADEIKNSRPFKWWQAVDILLDILNDFPTIWISSFQTADKGQMRDSKTPVEAMIKMDCLSLDGSTELMTKFRRRLKNTPELTQTIFSGGINEELSFDLIPLSEAKEEWAVKFLIELYRIKK
jgi:hypothetical protein